MALIEGSVKKKTKTKIKDPALWKLLLSGSKTKSATLKKKTRKEEPNLCTRKRKVRFILRRTSS